MRALWKKRANYWQGKRALGGTLRLTEESLLFRAHALEGMLGGRAEFSTSLERIHDIECLTVGHVLRKRMIVRTDDQPDALFLVPDVEQRAGDIRDAARNWKRRDGR